jgi:OOP family OmpA-OmpF porin
MLFVSASAFAGNSGTYYGAIDYQAMTLKQPTGGVLKNPDASFRLAGGYNFSPILAVEVGYSKIGDMTCSGCVTVKTVSLQVAAVGTYSINSSFDLFGKLGVAMNSVTLSAPVANTTLGSNELLYGIGGQYNINKKMGVRVQYESLGKFLSLAGAGDYSLTAISVGAVYNF